MISLMKSVNSTATHSVGLARCIVYRVSCIGSRDNIKRQKSKYFDPARDFNVNVKNEFCGLESLG